MASRRMFSHRIINSARFLMMPISCQALYFHLGMNADDDGIVEAYPIIKMVGCSADDLKVLYAKGFVQILNEELVTFITDWNENNKIRPDRKIDSIYKDLLIQLNPDISLIEKRPRADAKSHTGQSTDGQRTDNGQPKDGIGKDRLGKDRLGQVRLGKDRKTVGAESEKDPAPGEPPIITIPLNDGTEYPVTKEQFDEWLTLYPAVDVLAELRKMRGWCLENRAKRKTKNGVGRFIVSWLSREQDKPHKEFSGYQRQNQNQNENVFLSMLEGRTDDQGRNTEDSCDTESGISDVLPWA